MELDSSNEAVAAQIKPMLFYGELMNSFNLQFVVVVILETFDYYCSKVIIKFIFDVSDLPFYIKLSVYF